MNKSIMMGRLVRDPEMRYSETSNGELAIANFRLAVDRKYVREGDPTADFFRCTAFGKKAEFVEAYLRQGIKVVVEGRMQNDNYTNRDGERVYSVCLMVDDLDFAESKKAFEERQEQETGGNSRSETRKNTPSRAAKSSSDTRERGTERSRSENGRRRTEREEDYPEERSSARSSGRSRSSENSSARRSQERSRSIDDRFMEAPDEELDFD